MFTTKKKKVKTPIVTGCGSALERLAPTDELKEVKQGRPGHKIRITNTKNWLTYRGEMGRVTDGIFSFSECEE